MAEASCSHIEVKGKEHMRIIRKQAAASAVLGEASAALAKLGLSKEEIKAAILGEDAVRQSNAVVEDDEFCPPMGQAELINTRPLDDGIPDWERGMNPEQAAVIAHIYGPLFCSAQAGTGKTRALVNRIARLVRVEHVDPKRILAVTFSTKAAGEMNKRLDEDLGIISARVGTWHSLSLQIIKEDRLPCSQWSVDEKDRHKWMVKDAIGWKHVDWKGADISKVLGFIGWCKAHLWEADSKEAAEYAETVFGKANVRKAITVYSVSDDLTHQAGLLTFDDMLFFVGKYLQIDDNAAPWAARWDFVLQDEAQDANTVQMVIARALASGHRNYMIVGDKNQSIYGFRGSDPKHFIGFEDEWEATVVHLCRNYRSADSIVTAANSVIRHASDKEVDMIPMRGVEGKVSVQRGETLDDEANSFVSWVKGHACDGHKLGSCTALFRTNAQSRALEEALLSARIPYVLIGGHSFYERREIKDLLAYLRVAMERDPDGDAVKRCINAPFRFLGQKFVDRMMDLGTSGCDWTAVARQASQQAGIQRRQEASVSEWLDIIGFIKRCTDKNALPADAKPGSVLNALVSKTGYLTWLEKEEGEESIESSHSANVRELIRVAERFSSCKELLDYIDKVIKAQKRQSKSREEKTDSVLLMSIHRAKGLEWDHVWVVGCNEGVLPHGRGEPEEERRLMYVAMTRARNELVLSWVKQMALRGGVKVMVPSHFLSDGGLETGFEEEEFDEDQ